jgi:ABC-type sugar transport system permease subunit/serine/threonine protein kinase
MLTTDTIIQNRYRVVCSIGRGGFGAVYEATHVELGTTVALKQMLVSGEDLDKAFQREARLLAHLNHPALPRVTDYFSDEAGKFLVMDFIPGPDLGDLLKQRGRPFPLADVLLWADQFLDALEYLHSYDPPIIHRDIKPQNIKLTPRGQIMLLDFGLAKGLALLDPNISNSGETSRSLAGYTPTYAPLEQIEGTGTDARSDLYALAATLYNLITGVSPASAMNRATTLLRKQPDPLRPAHMLNAQVPEAVSQVLAQALSLSSEERPSSAAVMRAMLQSASYEAPPFVAEDSEPALPDALPDRDDTIQPQTHLESAAGERDGDGDGHKAGDATTEDDITNQDAPTIAANHRTPADATVLPVTRSAAPDETLIKQPPPGAPAPATGAAQPAAPPQRRGALALLWQVPLQLLASLVLPLLPLLVFLALHQGVLWLHAFQVHRLLIGGATLVAGVGGGWLLFWLGSRIMALLPRAIRDPVYPLLLVGPAMLMVLAYLLYPAVATLSISLYGPDSVQFVGGQNYLALFLDDAIRTALRNTLLWMVVVPISTVVPGLLLAVLLQRAGRWQPVARALICLPLVLSGVAASIIWGLLYQAQPADEAQTGLINALIVAGGGAPLDFLGTPLLNSFALMLIMVWVLTGFCTLLLSAAVQRIPPALIEGARLDGAGEVAILFRVIVPALRGPLIVAATSVLVIVIKVFDVVYVLTQGDAQSGVVATHVLHAIAAGNDGQASALVMLMVAATLPVLLFTIARLRAERR